MSRDKISGHHQQGSWISRLHKHLLHACEPSNCHRQRVVFSLCAAGLAKLLASPSPAVSPKGFPPTPNLQLLHLPHNHIFYLTAWKSRWGLVQCQLLWWCSTTFCLHILEERRGNVGASFFRGLNCHLPWGTHQSRVIKLVRHMLFSQHAGQCWVWAVSALFLLLSKRLNFFSFLLLWPFLLSLSAFWVHQGG